MSYYCEICRHFHRKTKSKIYQAHMSARLRFQNERFTNVQPRI